MPYFTGELIVCLILQVDSSPLGQGTLEMMSLKSGKRSVLKKYDDDPKRPHKIVLDPNEKFIFVSYPVPVKVST